MKISSLTWVALVGVVLPPPPSGTTHGGELTVRHGNRVARGPFSAITVLPGATVTLEAPNSFARSGAGRLAPVADGQWRWTAPATPGFYPISVIAADHSDSVTIHAFVLVPTSRVRNGYLKNFRIGRYSRQSPAGFVEVTRDNENVFVSPHFRLKQFVCKQSGGYPKYVALDERLLDRLETLLQLANDSGYTASTFHVMSGFRTPAYNTALGNVPNSRHTLGAAADIFIDENSDGRMDDLNRDGKSDVGDAEVLYRLFDGVQARGGLGKYRATRAHGPFVHVDIRDRRARW